MLLAQPVFTCSKSIMETTEQCVNRNNKTKLLQLFCYWSIYCFKESLKLVFHFRNESCSEWYSIILVLICFCICAVLHVSHLLGKPCWYFVGNKAKGQISKWFFQENKARQIFRKTNISYPLICTSTCAYQRVRNVCFSEILTCSVFLKQPFWDSLFCLITDDLMLDKDTSFLWN